MATGQRQESAARVGECRQCSAWCDKLVDPAGCIEIGCRYLYSYDDPLSGRTFMGCLQKVFKGEIDVEQFADAQASSRAGFGGIKMTGEPMPQCQFRVERSFEGHGPDYECVNKRFFDAFHE